MPNSPIHNVDQRHFDRHDAGRETLSALFDGQLEGDAARFALKRLGHDVQWRRACGHWQLAGDVLRRESAGVAPLGFAEGVMAAVARESLQAAPAVSSHTVASAAAATARRRWVGGAALAASVALAALFVVRPLSQTGAPVLEAAGQQVAIGIDPGNLSTAEAASGSLAPTSQVASVPQASIPQGRVLQAPDPQAPAPASPADGAHLAAAAAIAVAELPRRAGERRSRGQSQRAAMRSAAREAPTQRLAAASASPVTGTLADTDGPSLHPFQPRGEIASRPWPRAVLSDYPGAGAALTASYGSGGVIDPPSPSFYPFEPQALQADVSASRSDWPQPTDRP